MRITVNKKLFGQDLITDPNGYRIAIGKNTEEDTKNFDADSLNNIRVKKYDITFENNNSTNLLVIDDIPDDSVIWDIKLYVSAAFNADGSTILLRDSETGDVFYSNWVGLDSDDTGFVTSIATEIPKLKADGDIDAILTASGANPSTEGEAVIYVHYSILT